MSSIIHDGETAVTSEHAPWCDPSEHDDGTTHPIPDSNWQICFSEPRELEFSDRDNPYANVESIRGELSFAHDDVWGERDDVLVHVDANHRDGFLLTPDQLLPIAMLLLSLDAEYKGDTERSAALMAEARASVVEIEPDTGREARREAARRAWALAAEAEAEAERAAAEPEPVRHAAASYQLDSPQRTKSFCGAEGGGIAAAWNYVTCPACKPAAVAAPVEDEQQSEAAQYWALADIHQSEASDPNATPEQQAVARAAHDDAVRCAQAAEESGR